MPIPRPHECTPECDGPVMALPPTVTVDYEGIPKRRCLYGEYPHLPHMHLGFEGDWAPERLGHMAFCPGLDPLPDLV